jgi:MoaA/NifB/PqqE/SkfB family radical SAM enzyme
MIIQGYRSKWMFVKIWTSVSFYLIKKYKSPIKFYKIIKGVVGIKKRYTKEKKFHNRMALVNGRVFFNCNNVGWPSKHFFRMIDLESRKTLYNDVTNLENLRIVQLAFTKKCPLNCEHCYEGDVLNKRDTLSLEDNKKIIAKLQKAGIPMIHFAGGEPMAKVNDLVELIASAEKTTDFWVLTSGFNLNERNTRRLKKAGLTGVSIGLDHHIPSLHNKFRRNEKAFGWAMEGAKNTVQNGLVLTFNICLTRDFTTKENLYNYLKLAHKMGASFVQLLEPRSVGNYAGKEVHLLPEQTAIVDEFFLTVNRDPNYRDMPIVMFPGYHQKRIGCTAAGFKFLYIDTDGYMSSCPFCRNQKTHILDSEHESNIDKMKAEGCDLIKELEKQNELVNV